MGVSARPIGKFKSVLKRIDNENVKKREESRKKDNKNNKKESD